MAGSVDRDGDIHGDRCVGARRRDGIQRHGVRERVVETGGCGVHLGDRSVAGGGVRVGVVVIDDCEGVGLIGGFGAGAGCDVRAHPYDVGGTARCFDDHVRALADLFDVSFLSVP